MRGWFINTIGVSFIKTYNRSFLDIYLLKLLMRKIWSWPTNGRSYLVHKFVLHSVSFSCVAKLDSKHKWNMIGRAFSRRLAVDVPCIIFIWQKMENDRIFSSVCCVVLEMHSKRLGIINYYIKDIHFNG